MALAIAPNTPLTNLFTVPITNGAPLGGPFTATLTATDAAGNSGTNTRTFRLLGPPPTLQITRVAPTNGPVPSSSDVVVDITGSSANGIGQLVASMTGAAEVGPVTNNGPSFRLRGTVAGTNLVGAEVQIAAEAFDTLGQSSGRQTLTLTVSDGTAPNVAVFGPTNGAVFLADEGVDLSTVISDNSSNATLSFVVYGSVTATQSLALALSPNVAVTNFFSLRLTNASPLGGPFTARFTATDGDTNVTVASRTYRLKGAGPTLEVVQVSPTNGLVLSSQPLIMDVVGSSSNGISQVVARVTGAVTLGPLTNNGSSLRLESTVAATNLAGAEVQLFAEVFDTLGQRSGEYVLPMTVSDGTDPALTVLGPTNSTLFAFGDLLELPVIASDNSSNLTLGFSIFGSITATQRVVLDLTPNTPLTNRFSVGLTNVSVLGGPFTATVTATDAASNAVTAVRNYRLFGPAPTIQFTRVAPLAGPVPSGSTVAVSVTASGGNGIAQLTARMTGAATNGPVTVSQGSLLMQGVVAPTAQPGETVRILAEATDSLGQSSGEQSLVLQVSDGTPPALAILGPPDNSRLPAGQPLDLSVSVSDNSSNVTLGLSISGALAATGTTTVPLTPNAAGLSGFTVPLTNMAASSGLIAAVVTATDAAGNTVSLTRRYWIAPSQTSLVTWNRQALGQTFSCTNGSTYSWPSNNNWSQSALFGDPCHEGQSVVVAPSNWSTTNYPNGAAVDVVLGGIGGAPANLDVTVTLNSLTIQSNGGLTLRYGTVLTAASIDLQGDGNLGTTGQGYYSPEPAMTLAYGGTLMKSGGDGVFAIDPIIPLTCVGGTIAANSGTLLLSGGGSVYSNDTFTAAAGAVLDLVPAGQNVGFAGTFTGSGAGQVQLNNGAFVGRPATLNFPPSLFQWIGGRMNRVITNVGTLTVTSTNNHQLWDYAGVGTAFYNAGHVRHANGTVDLESRAVTFHNLASGTYDLTGDGSVISSRTGSSGGAGTFENRGLLRKSGGTNSVVSSPFNNLGGTIEVASGTLGFSADGGSSSNGTIIVAAGAVLDLTGSSSSTWYGPTWRGLLTASGAGQVQLNSGVLWGEGVTLDFPAGLFQWNGGRFAGSVLTNVGVITLTGTNAHQLLNTQARIPWTNFFNLGLFQHDSGTLDIKDGLDIFNGDSGTYEIDGDGSLTYSGGSAGRFLNAGLLRKHSGTNSIFMPTLKNLGGTIQVDAGTLALQMYGDAYSLFDQGGGTLSFGLGGRDAGQWGQLTCSGWVTLAGTLNVFLANGFVPVPGDEFKILSGYRLGGTFTSATLPFGGALRFTNNAVYVVFSGQTNLPPALQFTQVSPTNGPVPSGSSFTVDLAASDDDGIVQILANVSGVVTNAFTNSGASLRVTGTVPPTAVAGQTIQIVAQALSLSGQTTTQGFSLPVSDGTPPALTILDPPRNALLPLTQPLNVAAQISDNSTNVTLRLATFGSLAVTQTLAVALTPNVPATNVFTVPMTGADPAGGQFTASVIATDATGNATTNTTAFWLPPAAPVTVIWQRQALGQSFVCPSGGGSYTWPNNNNWSQSALFGDPCHVGTNVMTAPSNWTTTNAPNGTIYDVILGGLGGAPVNLDISVTLNKLTIQADGGLHLPAALGTSLTAMGFDFQGDGMLVTRDGCSSPNTLLLNAGTMRKSAGTNAFTIQSDVILKSLNGTLAVDSGTLVLPGNNSSYTDGAFQVASNATLNLVPSGQNASFSGLFTGSGDGTVLFNAGSISAGSGGVTFNLPAPLFQWSGGTFAGSVRNLGAVSVSGANASRMSGPNSGTALFNNEGWVRQSAGGGLVLGSYNTVVGFNNLAAGKFQFTADSSVSSSHDAYSSQWFQNSGLVWKSAGTNVSTISVPFNNQSGAIQVDSGTLVLSGGGSSFNGVFTVASGAVLDLTGGSNPTWRGDLTGTGGGRVWLGSGTINAVPSLKLNFPANLFQWNGGYLGGAVTNLGVVEVAGTNTSQLTGGNGSTTTFNNRGLVRQTTRGGLRLGGYGAAVSMTNQPGATYQFAADSDVVSSRDAYSSQWFHNSGWVWKSGGTNAATISIPFHNQDGAIQVDSGTLVLSGGGSSSNGTVTVAGGAALDLTGGNSPIWQGTLNGSGAGQVLLRNGSVSGIPSLDLNFPMNVFQWGGGNFVGTVNNLGVVSISGTDPSRMTGPNGGTTLFNNEGWVQQNASGGLILGGYGTVVGFNDLAAGTYQFTADSGIASSYDAYSSQWFQNSGRVWKSGGIGVSAISIPFRNQAGAIQVDAGQLVLSGAGTSSNATISVAAGALLDLTGGNTPTWQGLINGTGEGVVLVSNGRLIGDPAVYLNFAPGLFQWTGGELWGTFTNLGMVSVSGTNASRLAGPNGGVTTFNNPGLVRQTGPGGLVLGSYGTAVALTISFPARINCRRQRRGQQP